LQVQDSPQEKLTEVWTGVAILIGDPPKRTATHLGGILQLVGLALALGGFACFAVLCAAGARLRRSSVAGR
jgi:hypothetical protein